MADTNYSLAALHTSIFHFFLLMLVPYHRPLMMHWLGLHLPVSHVISIGDMLRLPMGRRKRTTFPPRYDSEQLLLLTSGQRQEFM